MADIPVIAALLDAVFTSRFFHAARPCPSSLKEAFDSAQLIEFDLDRSWTVNPKRSSVASGCDNRTSGYAN
ncbi:hypothetical protein OZ411_15315 [Bradyrhizobium sp. Arg237L]|uniref:hypothetical protein n=1 Tax=Bradyrhizobium sp. Arg237L TaxID=3003352 RepID=UPI00249F1BAE|nr:hypothetical protein [Bradyrhizobium sp. Arg237L]MDI4234179.1 hypothetical protein [Bradyrhizobium sp. Arg237L]